MTASSSRDPIMQNAIHNQRKKDRGNRQIARLEEVVSGCHDPESMAEAVFGQWPQQLPKPVLRRIGGETKKLWTEMRNKHELARAVANMDFEYGDEIGEAIRSEEIESDAIARYHPLAEKILALAESIPDGLSLTLSAVHPDDMNETKDEQRSFYDTWIMADVRELSEPRSRLLISICIALAGTGGLIVRQQLKLRVQTTDEQGRMVWRPQERVYGVQCLMGEVTLMTEREVRHAYTFAHDTGEPLPLLAGTSYGDMKAYARQKGVSFDTPE